MRIDGPVLKTIFLTFHQDNGITRDTRAISIVEADREEVVALIKELFRDELERKGEPLRGSVKLTVQVVDRTSGSQKKDEFSYRLYRCNVNVIERLIIHLKGK